MKSFWMKVVAYYRHLFFPSLNRKSVKKNLELIDKKILSTPEQDIPNLFTNLSTDLFGKLLMDVPSSYPNIKAFFPSMVPNHDQDLWTGTHGLPLLIQSLAFIKSLSAGYQEITGRSLAHAKVLDFGCGWGRLIRLLYKFVPYKQIFGIDPWEKSIEICRSHNIKANLAVSEYIPQTIPFDVRFDLIFAFSVFTHLSEKACTTSLSTLRKYISDDGLLVITIRPRDYWFVHEKGSSSARMTALHDDYGFAFIPQKNMSPIDGDVTYGDTSISIEYFKKNFPQWRIVRTVVNPEDAYQTLLFLLPA